MAQSIKRIQFLLAFSLMAMMACSPKVLPSPDYTRDSVKVEIRERVVTIHDTVAFQVPVIEERNITTDTSSHIEDDWLVSDALVTDGRLIHTASTKPHVVYIPREVPVPVHDTLIFEKTVQGEIQYIPAELTRREQRLIRRGKAATWVLIIAAVTAIAVLLWKNRNVKLADIISRFVRIFR